MKFVCNGMNLADAVVKAGKACAIRTTAPIMECIKITAESDKVVLTATDGELSIRKILRAEVFDDGETCVPGKLLSDFVGKLTEMEVTVETNEKGLGIKYGDSFSDLQTLPAEEFPVIDFEIGENFFTLKQKGLKKVITETSFCCAQDESRPILKGCNLEFKDKLEVTALDGYRLAISQAEIEGKSGEKSVICPARTLGEIAKLLTDESEDITIYTQGGMMLVKIEDMTIVSRLYQGEFIRKESVLPPSYSTEVTVSRAAMTASAERAAILNRGDRNNLITFEIGSDHVIVRSVSEAGKVLETVKAAVRGIDLTISMNAKFLLDALRSLNEEEVVVSFNGPTSPFILQNKERKDSLYLILPVKNA